jgi:hypothetical protein
LEVDVFDAESAAFHQPHACAVHQPAEHLHGAGREVLEELSNFIEAENDGDALRPFGSDGFDFELRFQDFSEEEEQGGEGLVLGAGSDIAIDGEVGEKRVNLVVSHFRGMHPAVGFFSMEAEKAFHPIDVSPFGANRKMLSPHELSGLFEQGRFERPGGGGLGHNGLSRLRL